MNRIISLSGLFLITTNFFGGQSANIAGMATVICSDEEAGPKEKRYMGAVVTGFLLLIFGIFSWKLVPLIQALPKEFISIIVGFSLLSVFGNSLYQSFSKQSMKISAAFAFIIALSNITILNVSAPVTVPHYINPPFKKIAQKIIDNYSSTLNLCSISNKDAILVNGNEVKVERN